MARAVSVLPLPTRLGWYFLGAWLLMFVSGTYYDETSFVLLSCVPLALLLINGALVWAALRNLELGRVLPAECHAGEPVDVRLHVRNLGWFPRLMLELRDDEVPIAQTDRGHGVVTAVYGGSTASARYQTTFSRRGAHRLRRCEVRTAFPFGLMAMRREFAVDSQLTVYPRPVRLSPELEQRLLEAARYFGDSAAAARGQDEVFGVREYLPGHNVAHIHWKSTARTGKPMVLELEGRQDASFVLILDTHEVGEVSTLRVRLESAIALTAGLTYFLTTQKALFRFAACDDQLHAGPRQRGDRHYHAIMRYLAHAGTSELRLSDWLPELESIGPNELPVLVTLGPKEHAEAALGNVPGAVVIGAADADFRRNVRMDAQGRRSISQPELADAGLQTSRGAD
jgi:uncharacterized protein (DUF58 family)